MTKSDFYSLLNVTQDATQEEIKRAYRKLSMKWHPDKNPGDIKAEEKFKEINEAYSILSDSNKRDHYDMTKNGSVFGGVPDFFNIFMGQGAGQPMSQAGPNIFNINDMFTQLRKPAPIITNITISLIDAYNGVSVPITIKRWNLINDVKHIEDEVIYINVPPGIDNKEILMSIGKGNTINGTIKGDVKIFVHIENDTAFSRTGLDLNYTKEITLKEALCGFSFELEHLNGIRYQINNNNWNIINPNYKKTIPQKGMNRNNTTGNLNIHFFIKFPKELSETVTEQLRTLL